MFTGLQAKKIPTVRSGSWSSGQMLGGEQVCGGIKIRLGQVKVWECQKLRRKSCKL